MTRYSLITNVPVHSGSLHRAVSVVAEKGANINRIHYDRRVDSQTVFWELTATAAAFEEICAALTELGYLLHGLTPFTSARLTLRLPHEPGALNAFLQFTTDFGAIISALAFDDRGSEPDTVTVTAALDDGERAHRLVTALSRRFAVKSVQFDGLEDISFYVQFLQRFGEYVSGSDPKERVDLVVSINRLAQDLSMMGEDPRLVFENVLQGARTVAETRNDKFYADIQTMPLSDSVTLHCIQPPCGGNVYLFETPDGNTMLDTGYGAYCSDLTRLFRHMDIDIDRTLSRIILSHGDVDHSGGAGRYTVPILMHRSAYETLRTENRAWGSPREEMLLETIYSKMIGAVSDSTLPSPASLSFFESETIRKRGVFPVMGEIEIGDLRFEILESLGGHQVGEVFLFCPREGYLFSADSLINLKSISPERTRYNKVADYLMTTVNVSSDAARSERLGLLAIAAEFRRETGRACVVFGGHGPISVEADGKLRESEREVRRYTAPADSGVH